MKKTIAIGLILALILALTGCGNKPETAIDNYFDAVKKYDSEGMIKTLAPSALDELGQGSVEQYLSESGDPFDKPIRDYLKENAAKITYEVMDTKVNGDEATVTVKCKYADGSQLFGKIIEGVFAIVLSSAFAEEEMTEEEITAEVETLLEDNLKSTEVTFAQRTIEIPCVKVDGTWYVKTVSDELADVVTSNLFTAAKDYADIFEE